MLHGQATEAEPQVQHKFRIGTALSGLALFAAVIAAEPLLQSLPDRQARPHAVALLEFAPAGFAAADWAPLLLVDAWRVTSRDPRVGGVSALAVDGDELVAVTDTGAVLQFPKAIRPQLRTRVRDLPSGPGDERFKMNRDSEAIARDPDNRGWWIAFENRDELWLYDWGFARALQRVVVPRERMSLNAGIEGLASGKGGLLAFPESGGSALSWSSGRWGEARVEPRTPLSDAVRLDDGSVLLVERRLTATGFSNVLALVRADGATFRTVWRKRLPVGRRDNVEALAAERTDGGGYRLWMMTDDNFHPRLRTVLLVVDIPAGLLRKQP